MSLSAGKRYVLGRDVDDLFWESACALSSVEPLCCASHRELRTLVIEMVMSTDMSCHFQQIKTMRNTLQQPEG